MLPDPDRRWFARPELRIHRRPAEDENTRRNGGSNADDIKPILKDLPIEQPPIVVPTSLDWHGNDEVVKFNPDLIIIHLSCFYKNKQQVFDSDKKFRDLMADMAKRTHSKFLVYTRGLPSDAGPELQRR